MADKKADIKTMQKIKGVDFCLSKDYCYIIRSDLGCYMRSSDLNTGSDLSIHALHPCCQHGDHYLADKNDQFYIIKGDSYRRVTDLTEDTDSSVYTLHPDCRGGDHYLAAFGKFYIIFDENNKTENKRLYRIKSHLRDDHISMELHVINNDRFKDGLDYWGGKKYFYFLKPTDWGVEYYKGTDLNKDKCTAVSSVHPDVLNFLPGGLSITSGPAFGKWMKIKYVSNDSPIKVTFIKKVTKKVGYNKEKMSQITHNWKIETSGKITTGKLAGLISDAQFSLSGVYERSRVDTEKENWNEETVMEEQLSFELKPHERLYVWQYQLGLGSEPVLFCRDLKITDTPNPSPVVPLSIVNMTDPQELQDHISTQSS